MKSIVSLVLVALMAVSAAAITGPELRMRNMYNGPPMAPKVSVRSLSFQWIDQRIDNFDAQNLATYRMVSIVNC